MKHMIATGALALAMLTGPAVAQEAAPIRRRSSK